MADERPVHVGILGKGTVGGAFKELLEERADMVEEVSGRRARGDRRARAASRATSTRSSPRAT